MTMPRICAKCGFETRQDHFSACIQCGAKLDGAVLPSAEDQKQALAEALRAGMLPAAGKVPSTAKPDPSKSLVFWGYFVLFLPFLLESVNGRMPYQEGNLAIIYFHFTKLMIPIGIFTAHLLVFREKGKAGAILGIILALGLMSFPALFLRKHYQSITIINEMHEGMRSLAASVKGSFSAGAGKLPELTYDREKMHFRQSWTADQDSLEEVRAAYAATVQGYEAKIRTANDFSKMFMYGLTYEITFSGPNGEKVGYTIDKARVQELFKVRR